MLGQRTPRYAMTALSRRPWMLQELGQACSLRFPALCHPCCRSAASSTTQGRRFSKKESVASPEKTQESVASQVEARLKNVKEQTRDAIKSQWREEKNPDVPYRFRIRDPSSTQ